MLPKIIIIQGLYSYKTRQTIDFEALTSQHLFGIFGPVGSGKSSILDAITFALYGEIERINAKEGRAENIFNRESEEFLIDFQFEAGAGNQLYRFVVRNSRKKNGDPKTFERSAYQWKNKDWEPMQISTAESVFNLSYENFKRTIIIPQGKFQEFFSLRGAERTAMMMELFPRLAEFDLADIVRKKLSATNLELSHLQGNLESIGLVEESEIAEKQNQIERLEAELTELDLQVANLEKMMEQFRQSKIWFQELYQAQTRLNELEPQEAENNKMKEKLEEYELLSSLFETDFRLLEKSETDWEEWADKLKNTRQEVARLEQKLKEDQAKMDELLPLKQALPELENQLKDWEIVGKIKNLQLQSAEYLSKLKETEPEIEDQKEKRNAAVQNRKEWDEAIARLEEKANNLKELLEAKQGLVEQNRLANEAQTIGNKLSINAEQLQRQKGAKEERLKSSEWAAFPQWQADLKLDDILKELAETRIQTKNEKTGLEHKKQEIQEQDHLFQFSNKIKEGEPCPLCGSTHHPQVLSATDVSQQKAENEALIQQKTRLLENLNQLEIELTAIRSEVKNLMTEKANLENQHREIQSNQIENQKKLKVNPFVAKGLDAVEKELELENEQAEKLKMARDKKKAAEDEMEKADRILEGLDEKKRSIHTELATLSGQEQSLREQMNTLKPADWENLPQSEISRKMESLSQKLDADRSAIESAHIELTETQKLLLQYQTTEGNESSQAEKLSKEIATQQAAIDQNLKKHNRTEKEVKEKLAQNLEITSLRANLSQYFTDLTMARQNLKSAREKTEGLQIDEQKERETAELLKDRKDHFSRKKELLGEWKSTVKRLADDLSKSQKIRKKMEGIGHRKDNLQMLSSLFTGNAFVNYASSRYLKNIVEMANERFFKMTRQRLRLELDHQNNFLVKDYLNEGHLRLAKTLSGGQTFQASLCLALALADSIGHITQSTRSFFFLDEGFGSLDKDALSMVFDTLRQLRNENRMVGLISHVEEFQQEIGLYADIRLDPEKGSLVRYSYQS